MNIEDGVYFGDSVWMIHAIANGKVYIRPLKPGETVVNIPYYISTHNSDGSQKISLSLCEVKPETPQAQHARKRARKQQPAEQLSLFDSGVGEGS